MGELAVVDEGPFWSRKLLEICGGLGHVSFTDAWTLVIQWYLYQNHGLNRTRFLEQPLVYRVLDAGVDSPEADRWDTDRRINFEFIASEFYHTMVKNQARNVALNIQAERPDDALPLKPTPSEAELEQILLATAEGAFERGNPCDAIREYQFVSERFPHNVFAQRKLAALQSDHAENSEISETPDDSIWEHTPKKHSKTITENAIAQALETASRF
jgi:hypothetical protein